MAKTKQPPEPAAIQPTRAPAWLQRCAAAADRKDSDGDLYTAMQSLLRSAPDELFLDESNQPVSPARLVELRRTCVSLIDGFSQRNVETVLNSLIPIELLRGLRAHAESGTVPAGAQMDIAQRRAVERADKLKREKDAAMEAERLERERIDQAAKLRARNGLPSPEEKAGAMQKMKEAASVVFDAMKGKFWDTGRKMYVKWDSSTETYVPRDD